MGGGSAASQRWPETCALLNDGHYIVYAVREGAKQSLNVRHSTKEYARGDVHVNTAESSHALIRRGLIGIYHNVSREYLHRYLWQFDFLWNNRQMNDGERTIAVKAAEGKRLMYKDPVAEREYIKTREQKKG